MSKVSMRKPEQLDKFGQIPNWVIYVYWAGLVALWIWDLLS